MINLSTTPNLNLTWPTSSSLLFLTRVLMREVFVSVTLSLCVTAWTPRCLRAPSSVILMLPKPLWMLYHHHVNLPAQYQQMWMSGSITRKTKETSLEYKLILLHPTCRKVLDVNVVAFPSFKLIELISQILLSPIQYIHIWSI